MKRAPSLVLMLLLVCLGAAGAVLYTPAMPMISDYFGVSDRLIELSMGIYLLGYAFGQLPYGPLSNRLGRKNALYIGLGLASFAAALSSISAYTSYSVFICSRLLFALGAAVGVQVIYTMIGDLYSSSKSVKMVSYMTLAFAMSPSVSTTIGGFLAQYLGWKSCFYFLFIYCVTLMLLCRTLPETLTHHDPHALKLSNIRRDYLELLRDRKIMLVAALIGFAIAFNYTFATIAPRLVIDNMGISPSNYGLLNIIPSASLVLGSILAGSLASSIHLNPTKQMYYASLLTVLGVLAMLGLFVFYTANTYSLFIPYALIMLGQPILEANAICLALNYHKNKSTTSAMINFVTLAISMMFSLTASGLGGGLILSMPLLFFILALCVVYLYKELKKSYL
jgi:MFS family permease